MYVECAHWPPKAITIARMRFVLSTVSAARRPLNGGSNSSSAAGYSGWSPYASLQKSGVNLRYAFERVEAPAAVRPVDDAALHAQKRELLLSGDDALDQGRCLPGRLQRQRRMPQQRDVVLSQEAGQCVPALTASFGTQDRHRLPAARAACHPEKRRPGVRRVGPAAYVHRPDGRGWRRVYSRRDLPGHVGSRRCRTRSGTSRRTWRTSGRGSTARRTWSSAWRPRRSSSRNPARATRASPPTIAFRTATRTRSRR